MADAKQATGPRRLISRVAQLYIRTESRLISVFRRGLRRHGKNREVLRYAQDDGL